MNVLDKKEGRVFARFPVYFLDRTEVRPIRMIGFLSDVFIRVPILEYMFCFNLFPPFNSNTFSDSVCLLSHHELKSKLVAECAERVEIMGEVLRARLQELRKLIQDYCPDLVERVPVL